MKRPAPPDARAPPVAWTVAGSDPGGGAGIQADIRVLHGLGVYGGSAITAVIAQNTRGVTALEPVSRPMVAAQLDALLADLPPRAVKLGALARSGIVREVAGRLSTLSAPVVCDPVFFSSGGFPLLDPAGQRALRRLLIPRADLLTPNRMEAGILAGAAGSGPGSAPRLAARLLALGARAVVLKGGHFGGSRCRDYYADGRQAAWLSAPRIRTRNLHGTGCVFSAAAAAFLALGHSRLDAVAWAKAYVSQGIRLARGRRLGGGRGPLVFGGFPSDPADAPELARAEPP